MASVATPPIDRGLMSPIPPPITASEKQLLDDKIESLRYDSWYSKKHFVVKTHYYPENLSSSPQYHDSGGSKNRLYPNAFQDINISNKKNKFHNASKSHNKENLKHLRHGNNNSGTINVLLDSFTNLCMSNPYAVSCAPGCSPLKEQKHYNQKNQQLQYQVDDKCYRVSTSSSRSRHNRQNKQNQKEQHQHRGEGKQKQEQIQTIRLKKREIIYPIQTITPLSCPTPERLNSESLVEKRRKYVQQNPKYYFRPIASDDELSIRSGNIRKQYKHKRAISK